MSGERSDGAKMGADSCVGAAGAGRATMSGERSDGANNWGTVSVVDAVVVIFLTGATAFNAQPFSAI